MNDGIFKIGIYDAIVAYDPTYNVYDEEIPVGSKHKTPFVVLKNFEIEPGERFAKSGQQYRASVRCVLEHYQKKELLASGITNNQFQSVHDRNRLKYFVRFEKSYALLANVLLNLSDFGYICKTHDRIWDGCETRIDGNYHVTEIKVKYIVSLDLQDGLNLEKLYDAVDRYDTNIGEI